jgi:hypothetical protein
MIKDEVFGRLSACWHTDLLTKLMLIIPCTLTYILTLSLQMSILYMELLVKPKMLTFYINGPV